MMACEKRKLKEKIEYLKEKMVNCAQKNGNKDLTDPKVYQLSKKLDKEIIKYMN